MRCPVSHALAGIVLSLPCLTLLDARVFAQEHESLAVLQPTPSAPHRVPVQAAPTIAREDVPDEYSKSGVLGTEDVLPRYLESPDFLGFASQLYSPPTGERIDPNLVRRLVEGARAGERDEVTFAYVMFEGRITQEKLDDLRQLGVEPLHYHPNNSYAVRIPVKVVLAVSQLPYVHWVGFAQPVQKLHPALAQAMTQAVGPEGLPIWVNLFESDLGPASERRLIAPPELTDPRGAIRLGNPSEGSWRWETHGRMQAILEERGLHIEGYVDEIHAYEARADVETILQLVELDTVAFVEWRPESKAFHDRVIPQLGQDYYRESYRATTETVGVIDSGFHLANGGYNGHVDLSKAAVGWNYWTGGCGHVFCDEASTGYHGTHVLGTVCGTGTANGALRGTSPYLGGSGAAQRLFLVKGLTTLGFQHMRTAFTDGGGNVTPKPVLVTNSWGVAGCLNNCTTPANWIGSEADARTADDEVFQYGQLYLFAAGNEGGTGGGQFVAGTIGVPAVAKNVLAVGMSRDGNRTTAPTGTPGSIVYWSSHGPCGDGRFKPNINAPGCSTESTLGGTQTSYAEQCGTSMSSPAAAGALAVVSELYPVVKDRAALYRAWAMASALPWQDEAPAGTWGKLSTAHLNAYGMGRVSALKAQNPGTGVPWTSRWATSAIGTGPQYFDIVVDPGVTRIVAVMTYDDPQAGAGASPATVEDIDLYIDQEPFSSTWNSGEFYSISSIDTVEHVIVNNPAAGNYRIKIYPYRNNTPSLRWGCMIYYLFGDTTPTGVFEAIPNTQYIQPGGTVDVAVRAGANSYIGTNVYVQQQAHTGFTLLGTNSTLKDGQALVDRHDVNGDFLLGDIRGGDTRTVTYHYRDTSGTEAYRLMNFAALSDNQATRLAAADVYVDGTPPGPVTNLRSTTHTAGAWSTNANITFAWSTAFDAVSGVEGYSVSITQGSPAAPDTTRDIGSLTSYGATLPSSATGYYFNIRAVDRCGNWNPSYVSTGPYFIDTVQPGLVSNLRSTSHTPGTWSNQTNVALAWSAATDAHSGLQGYGTLVSDDSPRRPGAAIDLGNVTSTTVAMTSGATPWYFNIRSADQAGNWDDDWASVGPFRIDVVAPTTPSNLRSTTHVPNTWSQNRNVTMAWTPSVDTLSGLVGYAALWDHAPGTVPTTVNVGSGATTYTTSLTDSPSGWYFHLRARDVATNWSGVVHAGPYLIDGSPPAGVTVQIDSGAANTTTLGVTLSVTASDPVSGLDAMRFRNDPGSFSPWEPFAATKTWNLSSFGGGSSTGTRRVIVEVRDLAGSVVDAMDTIYYYVPPVYFGTACSGSLGQPSFAVTGVPGVGRNITYTLSNTAASLAILYVGISNAHWMGIPLPFDLGALSSPGCFLNVSLDATLYTGPPRNVTVTLPNDPAVVDIPVHHQYLLGGDPSGKLIVTTRAATVQISGA